MELGLCKIVLVRPRDPNNIGAAARAMKNFGFAEMVVVAPYPPVWREAVSAVKAEDVLGRAIVAETVAEAVADCTLVAGTADRTRVEAKGEIYTPEDLSGEWRAGGHRLALLFGSEKHGLTNDDLSHCHRVVSIPTGRDCPSMNLGQAVAICCYELARKGAQERAQKGALETAQRAGKRATAGTIEALLELALDVLAAVDFLLPGNEKAMARKLRQTLLRYELTEEDAGLLCGMLNRVRRELNPLSHK